MSAGHWKLDNLIGIVDVNNHAGRRPGRRGDSTSSRCSRSSRRSAGTCSASTATTSTRWCGLRHGAQPGLSPSRASIICDTKMAKGVPFLEERESNHFLRVEPHEWQKALEVLDAGRTA